MGQQWAFITNKNIVFHTLCIYVIQVEDLKLHIIG